MADYVTTSGFPELKASLTRLGGTGLGRVMAPAMRAAAKPQLEAAKRLAPKASGQLAKALTIRALKRKRNRWGVAVQIRRADTFRKLRVHSSGALRNDFYPAYQEYGWDGGQHAKKYLNRAFHATVNQSIDIAAREIGQNIEKEAVRRGLI